MGGRLGELMHSLPSLCRFWGGDIGGSGNGGGGGGTSPLGGGGGGAISPRGGGGGGAKSRGGAGGGKGDLTFVGAHGRATFWPLDDRRTEYEEAGGMV